MPSMIFSAKIALGSSMPSGISLPSFVSSFTETGSNPASSSPTPFHCSVALPGKHSCCLPQYPLRGGAASGSPLIGKIHSGMLIFLEAHLGPILVVDISEGDIDGEPTQDSAFSHVYSRLIPPDLPLSTSIQPVFSLNHTEPIHLTSLLDSDFTIILAKLQNLPPPGPNWLRRLCQGLSSPQTVAAFSSLSLELGSTTFYLPLWMEKCLTCLSSIEGIAARCR